ncbi:HNH endonuclease [Terrarubrum flagellatum]|uniref:HNH endonuclease n=1 Tax=Terrirubrum flagellatum TaxID=2895980 RepID=UPI00314527E6
MAIPPKDVKLLWANAAGRCSFRDCRLRLCTDQSQKIANHTLGEMAHIRGERKGANRFDASQTDAERNSYDNLILLCPNHHTLIDKQANETKFSVEALHDMKSTHEAFVIGRLDRHIFRDKCEVAAYVFPSMNENHLVFKAFGPHSEVARKNPASEAHAVWLLERMSTIVPNNRRMMETIDASKHLFSPTEQIILSEFALHVRSYELWVRDEVNYEGVVRFPRQFEILIRELVDASA